MDLRVDAVGSAVGERGCRRGRRGDRKRPLVRGVESRLPAVVGDLPPRRTGVGRADDDDDRRLGGLLGDRTVDRGADGVTDRLSSVRRDVAESRNRRPPAFPVAHHTSMRRWVGQDSSMVQ